MYVNQMLTRKSGISSRIKPMCTKKEKNGKIYFRRMEYANPLRSGVENERLFLLKNATTSPIFPPVMFQNKTVKNICVIKAGSAVLTQSGGALDLIVLEKLCDALNYAHVRGWHPVLVTSGAVASGRGVFDDRQQSCKTSDPSDILKRIFAAMGQAHLLSIYKQYLEKKASRLCGAQVLLTKEAFSDPERYKHLCRSLIEMLNYDILPIINTNDVVQDPTLDFADNDQLASYVAATLGADFLILLTDTDGVYTKNPKLFQDARRIVELPSDKTEWPEISVDDTNVSSGGMMSKLNAMRLMADFGIPCCIANGKNPDQILNILSGNVEGIGTSLIMEVRRSISPSLKWMATGAIPEGTLIVSGIGAASIQRDDTHRGSILSIGVEAVLGEFNAGSIVAVRDESARFLGVGRTRWSSNELRHDTWKMHDTDVVRREHFLPLRQGISFVDERASIKRYISSYAAAFDFCIIKRKSIINIWQKADPEGFRFEMCDEKRVVAIIARSERMASELDIQRDDWLLYELASYYIQTVKKQPLQPSTYLHHTHDNVSFSIVLDPSRHSFQIRFELPTGNKPLDIVPQRGGIQGIMPSYDGSIVCVFFSNDSHAFFNTKDGKEVDQKRLTEDGIQFYQ